MVCRYLVAITGLLAGCASGDATFVEGGDHALTTDDEPLGKGCVDPPNAIHVAPDGNDASAGTTSAPLRTIRRALEAAAPGSTVVVHRGTYRELVAFPRSGEPDKPIVLHGACGERPTLDGTGLGRDRELPALVSILDRAHVTVEGFTLAKLAGAGSNFPAGIWVRGASSNVVIRDNVIEAIRAANGGRDAGAHGIAVYGTSTTPLSDVRIEGNELRDLVLGPSEALVINGNVRRFTILANQIHHANNIAFDFIGYERTCAACRDDDLGRAAVDRARDGLVARNVAHHITSRGNPAYGQDRSAGCFYVDGGGRITIERNVAHDCDLGVELASEHPGKATAEIVVRNNFLYANHVVGISTGGYDPGSGPGGGSAERCLVVHNTIVDSARDSWAQTGLLLQNRNVANVYVNNIIVATPGTNALTANGAGNRDNEIHHNLYSGGAVLGIPPGEASLTRDPSLVAPAAGDLHLRADSPAIGAGAPLPATSAGALDFDGQPRGRDLGADQH